MNLSGYKLFWETPGDERPHTGRDGINILGFWGGLLQVQTPEYKQGDIV